MKSYSRKAVLLLTDILLINFAVFFSLFIKYEGAIPPYYLNIFIKTYLVITIIKICINKIFGLYTSLWRYASIDELMQIFFAVSIGSIIEYLFGVLTNMSMHRSVYVITFILTLLFVGVSRLSYRIVRRLKRMVTPANDNKIRVMVIGAGKAGAMVIREMKVHKSIRYIPVVLIDDDKAKHRAKIHGVPVKGDRNKIVELVEKYKVGEIIFAIPSASKQELSDILNICKKTNCVLKTLPGVYELIDQDITLKQIRNVSIEDLLEREEVELHIDQVSDYIKDEIVLVTGGGGSIGSEICRQIAEFQPKKLLILDIYENNAYELHNELRYIYKDKLDFEVIIASIRDKTRIKEIFSKYRPTIIFHAAAHKHVPLMEGNEQEAIKNNVFGTLNIAQSAHEFGVKKFVFVSTDKAVNPTNIMGATKRLGEMLIQALDKHSNTKFVAVRFGNVLGSSGSVIPLFKKQIADGGPVTVTHPEITRYFMTILEASQLVIQAGAIAEGGEIFILDMGKAIKIDDLARDLIRLSGYTPDTEIQIKYTGLRPGEKLYEELLMDEEGIKATKHKGIFIGKPADINYNELIKQIKSLEFILSDSNKLRSAMRNIVVTYKYEENDAFDEIAVTKQ